MTPESVGFIVQSQQLADEYAKPGTIQYRLLQMGFMPANEESAEALLISLCEETDNALSEDYGFTQKNIVELRERRNTCLVEMKESVS